MMAMTYVRILGEKCYGPDQTQLDEPYWKRSALPLLDVFVAALVIFVLLQFFGSRGIQKAREDLLKSFEQDRKSRVIAMIHRQENVSFLGVPVSSHISIEDSEAVLRAIRFTPPDQPIDLILHTPGGIGTRSGANHQSLGGA